MLDNRQRRLEFAHTYEDIISLDNLLAAWKEFVAGKRNKKDVQEFQYRLMDNILTLHGDLKDQTYGHGPYYAFKISDPKPRDIHKATVRDRLVHHAVYRVLYPSFDRTWTADSYSCRNNKGTHRAMNRFREFAYQVSLNHTRTCWVLKCDIRKFFASIDHAILFDTIRKYITDTRTLDLIRKILGSFQSTQEGKGLPLGNLTSQLLVNVYMNEFDQFAKHKLKASHYIRYADDFVLLSPQRSYLEEVLPKISDFLGSKLALTLHPDKVYIKSFASGVDFLGWVHFRDHRVLRSASVRRMVRTLKDNPKPASVQSYRGMLSHGNAHKLELQHLT